MKTVMTQVGAGNSKRIKLFGFALSALLFCALLISAGAADKSISHRHPCPRRGMVRDH